MKQSRAMSLVESIINIAVGFGLSIGCQAIFLPLLGVPIPWQANLAFALVMTVVSIARQFCLRRIFEALNIRRPLTPFMQAVIQECFRQRDDEGWSEAHDDKHARGELAIAGACYLIATSQHPETLTLNAVMPAIWPWSADWWKPQHFRRDLVRGVALGIAEGDKFDRARHIRKLSRNECLDITNSHGLGGMTPIASDAFQASQLRGLTTEEIQRLTDAGWHCRAELIFPGPALDKARRFAS
jgi:hypothetical protein